MKGLTFATFTVDSNNRPAYDACQRVAFLKGEPGKPITLVGEKGTGKSHLLWSIVNHYREKQVRVSVALVSAGDFPRKVRNLGEDPAPIMKSRPAVLLVDEMERFKENLTELESVVRAFLDNGHIAILASRIHPIALSGYSGKFKSLLSSGSIIGMQAAGTAADGGIPRLALERIDGLKQTVKGLERERDVLKERLNSAVEGGGEASSGSGTAELEAERDRVRAALERSEGDLFETRQELAAVLETADKSFAELGMVAGLVEALSTRFGEVEAAQRSRVEALDRTMAGLEQDLTALAASLPAETDPALAAYDSLVTEKHAAEAALDRVRRESAQSMARSSVVAGEVHRLLDRALAQLMTDAEGAAAAEARKNVSDAIVCLGRSLGGTSAPGPGKAGDGDKALFAKRGIPGGDQLGEVVKKAFGDPVDADDDGEDFTYAEPAIEEDESETGTDRP